MICWQMGKISRKAKPHRVKVTTPKNPLINNQVVTSMRNLTIILAYPKIPTYNWTFVPIPNWTWSCTSVLSFMHKSPICDKPFYTDLSTWLTPATWMIVVGYKVLHFINDEDQEALGYKTLWRTNTVAFHKEN